MLQFAGGGHWPPLLLTSLAKHSMHLGWSTNPALNSLACGHCLFVNTDLKAALCFGPHSADDFLEFSVLHTSAISPPTPDPLTCSCGMRSSTRLHLHLFTASQTAALMTGGGSSSSNKVFPVSVISVAASLMVHPSLAQVATIAVPGPLTFCHDLIAFVSFAIPFATSLCMSTNGSHAFQTPMAQWPITCVCAA